MEACLFFERVLQELTKITQDIERETGKIIDTVSSMALMSVLRVQELQSICTGLLQDLRTGDFKKFAGNQPKVSEWKLPELRLQLPECDKNLFLIDLGPDWAKLVQEGIDCQVHSGLKVQILKCGQAHCLACLKELLRTGVEVCPCGLGMTPKEKMMVLKDPSSMLVKIDKRNFED